MKSHWIALITLVSANCLFAVAQSAEEPAWLKEARAKEGKLIKPVTIKSADGAFQAQVPAKLTSGKIEKGDGGYYLVFDIGSTSPLECTLDDEGLDLAGTLASADKVLFPEFEKAQGKIDRKSVEETDAGAIAGNPFLAAKWFYTADDGKGKKLGGLNQLVATKGEYGIYCFNSDVGFAKTFRAVATALIETLQPKRNQAKPYYAEIAVAEMRGKRVGLTRTLMTRDKDGDTEIKTTTAMLSTTAEGTLHARDVFSISWVSKEGSLINSVHVAADRNEVESNVKLQPGDDKQWKVTGTFKGKTIDATLPGAATPESGIEQTHKLRKYFSDGAPAGTTFSGTRWSPSADPTRFTDVVTTIGKTFGDTVEVTENEAGVEVNFVVDKATANAVSAVMQIGPTSVEIKRVFAQGSF